MEVFSSFWEINDRKVPTNYYSGPNKERNKKKLLEYSKIFQVKGIALSIMVGKLDEVQKDTDDLWINIFSIDPLRAENIEEKKRKSNPIDLTSNEEQVIIEYITDH